MVDTSFDILSKPLKGIHCVGESGEQEGEDEHGCQNLL